MMSNISSMPPSGLGGIRALLASCFDAADCWVMKRTPLCGGEFNWLNSYFLILLSRTDRAKASIQDQTAGFCTGLTSFGRCALYEIADGSVFRGGPRCEPRGKHGRL